MHCLLDHEHISSFGQRETRSGGKPVVLLGMVDRIIIVPFLCKCPPNSTVGLRTSVAHRLAVSFRRGY